MMSQAESWALNQEFGKRAAAVRRVPSVLAIQVEIDTCRTPPFPNLGIYVPPGWREVERHVLDKSGRTDGLALGLDELKEHLRPGRGCGIVEEGPFQVCIGEF